MSDEPRAGVSAPTAETFEPARVGPYRILRTIGRGGMGVVYEARDERLNRDVALKMLLPSLHDAVSRERLRREARTAASVHHPNVCQVYDVGAGDDLYIAMEMLVGEPLSSRVARGPMPVSNALEITGEILSALDALHAKGILHRDLKPSNVFLTPSGVKLLDFGLALPMEDALAVEGRLTQTGTVLGTPQYMAPERWRDDSPVGPESDVFSVGALLFEMLAGRPAYEGRTVFDVMRAVAAAPPSLEGGAGVDSVDRIVRSALAREPSDRYPTAAAMSLAITEARDRVTTETAATASVASTRVLVLPFRLLRPDDSIDFLGLGIADAVTTALSGLRSIVMRSPLAGARFVQGALDFAAVAREAAVDAVVAGTLLRAGERLRATAQLIEVPAGTVLFSDTIDATVGDVLALQDEIVRRIVESLSVPLSSRDKSGIQRKTAASARANDLYLRANRLAAMTDMLPAARDLYLEAIAEDPRFAPAWARLGRVYRVMSKYGYPDPAGSLRRAEEAFTRSLELDPELSLAHFYFTHLEVEERGRSREAMVRLLRRVRSRPAEAELFAALVLACRFCGLLDASLAADARARRLEPGIRTSVAFTHWLRGDAQAAISADDDPMRWARLYALSSLGREAEALALARELEARAPLLVKPMVTTTRAALEGRRDECLAATDSIFDRGVRDPEALFIAARNLCRVGENARALETLARVVAGGFHVPRALESDPWLAPLRTDPAFAFAVAESEAGRAASVDAYRAAGGEALLGPAA